MKFYVYMLTAADDTVLYVGHTSAPDRRMDEHASKHWSTQVANADVFEAKDKADALYVERNLIATTKPQYNIQSKPDPIKEIIRMEREVCDLFAGS